MTTKNMFIIRDVGGKIIAAQVEDPAHSETSTYITPTEPQHTLDRVSDVPAEIYDLADPVEFHRAITDHVNSEHAKVTRTNAAELHSAYSRVLASQDKKPLSD
jgi:hypothetical protein